MTAITSTKIPANEAWTIAPQTVTTQKWSLFLCCLLFALACLGYWLDRPFSQVLVSKKVSISALSPQQRLNIETATRMLNATVIRPGDEFSFNAVVGPRSASRGFLPAPAYVGNDAPKSTGGGICVLSSIVYQDALMAGLEITQRVAHMRTIHSIPAGLDATVWYGSDDLRFRNNLDCPVEVTAQYTPYEVTIELKGNPHITGWHTAELNRTQAPHGPHEIYVEVSTKKDGQSRVVSRDVYGIPTTGERHR